MRINLSYEPNYEHIMFEVFNYGRLKRMEG
jgi:hypothetical protein